jgi:protein TonB
VTVPTLVKQTQVRPEYPEPARKARVQGTVVLEAVVRRDGSVGEIRVIRSIDGDYGFEEASVQAIRQWRYRPGLQDGRPVDVLFTIVLEFVLE